MTTHPGGIYINDGAEDERPCDQCGGTGIVSLGNAGEGEGFCESCPTGRRMQEDADVQEDAELTSRLADILTRTANALKGDPGELMRHSWHDLPEVAARLVQAANAK